MPNVQILSSHGTDIGLRREINEDAYADLPELGLWLVADGMGGHAAGEIASALARDTVVNRVRSGSDLVSAVNEAHRIITAESARHQHALAMGTTMVAMQVRGQSYEIAWIGDSRAYRHNGELVCLTRDHSYVETLVQQGVLTKVQAQDHPHRNVITDAIGITSDKPLRVETVSGTLVPGQQFLLCTDGLTEAVKDALINTTMSRNNRSPQDCVDQLIAAALQGGGSDNITVVVIVCVEAIDPK